MKKFLIIALSAVFVLGLAATAFAIHAEIPSETQAVVAKGETQITLGGSIRIRGQLQEVDFNDKTSPISAYDQRVRLSLDAKVSDDVRGFIMLESANGSNTADTYTWGEAANGASGIYGAIASTDSGNAKRGDLAILQAWIDYKNDFLNLKIGHMPLALGNNIFFDHRKFGDDAIVLYKDVDSTHLAAIAIKLGEGVGGTAVSTDSNAYVALFSHKGDGFNVSGDVTWVNDNSFIGAAAGEADLINVGLRADTTLSNVRLKGDIEFQTGDTNNGIAALGCTPGNCDFSGMAAMASAEVDVDPLTVGLQIGYGSGDDNITDSDIDTFITSLNTGTPYVAFVYGTRGASNVAQPGVAVNAGLGFTNPGYSNLTFVKVSVSGSPGENVTAKADLIWLQASENVPNGNGTPTDDIGWEIDGKITYKLAKNLVYWIEGGYLIAGEVYDGLVTAGVSADDAFALRHGLELSF